MLWKKPHSAITTNSKIANCTSTTTPEAMIAFCASTLERQASRRWTTSWSEPWEAIANTAPPSREARKEFSPLSGLRSEEHTSELQSRGHLVWRRLVEKEKGDTLEVH